jgi:hypothetical protein
VTVARSHLDDESVQPPLDARPRAAKVGAVAGAAS